MRPGHASARVGPRAVQTPLFRLTDAYAAKDYADPEKLDRPFRPQFQLFAKHRTPTDHSIPIGPRPPQTCQRLTTDRPIESAPDKLNSLTQQISAGALHDWDLALIVEVRRHYFPHVCKTRDPNREGLWRKSGQSGVRFVRSTF